MADVFISYARKDNENANSAWEREPVVSYFVDLYMRFREEREQPPLDIFFDKASITPGSPISDEVRAALESCSAMITFYSSAYFESEYCRREYEEFKKVQERFERETGSRKLLVPVEAAAVDLRDHYRRDKALARWVEELTTGDGKHSLTSSRALHMLDNHELYQALERFDKELEQLLVKARRQSTTFAFAEKVRDGSMISQEFVDEYRRFDQLRRFHGKSKPVLVVYTGGTVGMVRDSPGSRREAAFRITENVEDIADEMRARLSHFHHDCFFVGLEPTIDSADVTAGDWGMLAKLIAEQMPNYEGFVVLHGTNTLAYTASALSFLLRDVISAPVILTGAEVPLQATNSDAHNNILNAISAATLRLHNHSRIAEVCVYWNGQLIRGNRTTKLHASDRIRNFSSPNTDTVLAKLEKERYRVAHYESPWPHDQSPSRDPNDIPNLADVRVEVLYVYPQQDVRGLESYYAGVRGLVLLTYGPGNAPSDPDFTGLIQRLISRGVIVLNVTQCPYGRVELQLHETSATLSDLGVIDGYDMTVEAAYCKLMWAIALADQGDEAAFNERVRGLLQLNQAGEMTADVDVVYFDRMKRLPGERAVYESLVHCTDVDHQREIDEGILRIDDLRLEGPDTLVITMRPGQVQASQHSEPFDMASLNAFTASRGRALNLRITDSVLDWYQHSENWIRIETKSETEFSCSAARLTLYSMRPYVGMTEPRPTPQFSEESAGVNEGGVA